MEGFTIASFNVEGISSAKIEILSNLKFDILCLQETHKEMTPDIPGMNLLIQHGNTVHGSAIYSRDKSTILGTQDLSTNGLEILRIETTYFNVVSVYKPPPTPFVWPSMPTLTDEKLTIVIGDFNSHSTKWGYRENNADGDAVEEWSLNCDLTLLHDAKDKPSFSSARWKRGYNPDLAFVSSKHTQNFEKSVGNPIPRSQHRPIIISVGPVIRPRESKPIPRFNFRKANWEDFTSDLDACVSTIEPTPDRYEDFQKLVWRLAKKHIPRGCRKSYIPCLQHDSKELYKKYVQAFETHPFDEETIRLGDTLMASIAVEKSERWHELISTTNMTHNSKKAWATIKKLNTERNVQTRVAAVTPNNVANQLIKNGKPAHKERDNLKHIKNQMKIITMENENQIDPFSIEELEEALEHAKPGKASGLDGITTEMIQQFGPLARSWVLNLFNNCVESCTIPKLWRRARVIALLKPGKDPNNSKSYRPISLLCILFKVYERMILGRITPVIEEHLTPDQAGFRAGRSCCDQLLNLTQFIEDGYENKTVTGAVFVDLTAAYDTVNHRKLLLKVARMIRNNKIVQIIQSLLSNRRFFVEMDGKKSRWRSQKNGLPQGSVLAPILFNIYTNDQPEFENIRRFLYADDLCLATRSRDFSSIEERLSAALKSLTDYYTKNSLNANPGKTQVCAFHLNNRKANRKLNIKWNGNTLENNAFPVYLGVTLDRTLSFSQHIKKVKGKVATRNSLLRKLANSRWGADPKTLRTTALALCYSSAEYAAPVWARSSHARKIDPELNDACRTITGTLKPTPVPALHRLAGIAPPHIRRDTASKIQKHKQETDQRHPLHNHIPPRQRLKSRKSFMTVESIDPSHAPIYRESTWKEADSYQNNAVQVPREGLPCGTHLTRKEWVTLNRARTKVGKTATNMHKWGFSDSSECQCGCPSQTMDHILQECGIGPPCSNEDLRACNPEATKWIQFWSDTI